MTDADLKEAVILLLKFHLAARKPAWVGSLDGRADVLLERLESAQPATPKPEFDRVGYPLHYPQPANLHAALTTVVREVLGSVLELDDSEPQQDQPTEAVDSSNAGAITATGRGRMAESLPEIKVGDWVEFGTGAKWRVWGSVGDKFKVERPGDLYAMALMSDCCKVDPPEGAK